MSILNRRGKVALFVGAGVSFGCGLPDWNTLLDRLIAKAYPDQTDQAKEATRHYSSISLARIIKLRLGEQFNVHVADALYRDSFAPSDAVKWIVKCGIRRILSYNFDDILEEGYATEGIEIHSVVKGDSFNNNFRGTAVFHPHGVLPANATRDELRNCKIVFSEGEYNELYSDPYHWGNLIQMSLLMNYTCLFVGCSFQDPNIRRLLDAFRQMRFTHWHYAIFRSPMYAAAAWEKPLARQIKSTIEADLNSLGVKPIWIKAYDELPGLFKSIRNKGERD